MMKLRKYIIENDWIVVLVLIATGFALLWGSKYFDKSTEIYILIINLGATLIVSAVAMQILSPVGKEIGKRVDEEIVNIHKEVITVREELSTKSDKLKDELTSKLDILTEAKKCGIIHIFESRRKDSNFKNQLIKQLEDIGNGKEVLLMGNSLRDFFHSSPNNNEYLASIFAALNRDIKIKILLLDPTSKAAIDRANVEENETLKSNGYIETTLFTEIKSVAQMLHHPPGSWTIDRNIIKNNIEVRFSPYDPTTFLVITDKYTFVEQYHRGGEIEIRETLANEGIPCIDCFGGFVPCLMVENSARFARLMQSHFNNIWTSSDVEQRDLRKNNFYQNILNWEKMEKGNGSKYRDSVDAEGKQGEKGLTVGKTKT